MNYRLSFYVLKLSAIAALFVTALLSGCNKEVVPPKLDVRFNTRGFFRTITVTSRDDRKVSVSKIIINRKEDNADCVVTKKAFGSGDIKDVELDIGDSVVVIADSGCNNPVVVGLVTNLGDYEVELNYNQ